MWQNGFKITLTFLNSKLLKKTKKKSYFYSSFDSLRKHSSDDSQCVENGENRKSLKINCTLYKFILDSFDCFSSLKFAKNAFIVKINLTVRNFTGQFV